jgi:16S rRNA (guanine966-N2)-methyltransferase
MSIRIYGNRLIKTLPGLETRPTLAKVREALFNIWMGRIHHSNFLDLCAGSGSIGAEALGRNASLVIGIDHSSKVCDLMRENWQQIAKPEQKFQIIRGNVMNKLKTLNIQCDRIYFDPPYSSNLYTPVLQAIASHNLLATGGEIAVEHSPQMTIINIDGLEICRQKNYGNTALTFYQPS